MVFGSVKGANHVRDNKCCQDAISIKEGSFRGKPYLICSVADGHGDSAYTHSDKGALLATLTAEQTTVQFLLTGEPHRDNRGELFAKYICRHLKNEWIENIKQTHCRYHVSHDMVRKYGTTLLCVLVYNGHVYMAQLGDGETCYLDREMNPVFLVEPETGPTISITDSLCSTDANTCWNFACIPTTDIKFLMLSTDGLMNSLADNGEYAKLAATLNGYLNRFRPSEINAALPEWLSDYSKKGSGDDISLVAINLRPNTNKHGEEHEKDTKNPRVENREKASGGQPRGSLPRGKKWGTLRVKALQRLKRHPGTEKYYLLSGARRHSRRRLHG